MKIVYTVQANGVDTSLNELEKEIKSALTEKGLKQKDINTNCCSGKQLCARLSLICTYQQSAEPVHCRAEYKQQHPYRLAPCIEYQRCDYQYDILLIDILSCEIGKKNSSQKEK